MTTIFLMSKEQSTLARIVRIIFIISLTYHFLSLYSSGFMWCRKKLRMECSATLQEVSALRMLTVGRSCIVFILCGISRFSVLVFVSAILRFLSFQSGEL